MSFFFLNLPGVRSFVPWSIVVHFASGVVIKREDSSRSVGSSCTFGREKSTFSRTVGVKRLRHLPAATFHEKYTPWTMQRVGLRMSKFVGRSDVSGCSVFAKSRPPFGIQSQRQSPDGNRLNSGSFATW